MARNAALPILTAEPRITHYLEEIRRFPMLERQEEYMLAKRWREHGDRDAVHKLVTLSHLKIASAGLNPTTDNPNARIIRDVPGRCFEVSFFGGPTHIGFSHNEDT
jgi:hypothetical protein